MKWHPGKIRLYSLCFVFFQKLFILYKHILLHDGQFQIAFLEAAICSAIKLYCIILTNDYFAHQFIYQSEWIK